MSKGDLGPFKHKRRYDEPCAGYSGNLCGGFGETDFTCLVCGWQRYEHHRNRRLSETVLAPPQSSDQDRVVPFQVNVRYFGTPEQVESVILSMCKALSGQFGYDRVEVMHDGKRYRYDPNAEPNDRARYYKLIVEPVE